MENLRMRLIAAGFGILLACFWVLPNLINTEGKAWLPKQKLNYGLDIQGGLHLVMGVDVAGVVSESTTRLANVLKAEFAKEGVSVSDVKATKPADGEIEVMATGEGLEKAVKHVEDRYASMLQKMNSTETGASFRYYDAYLNDYKSKVIHQAIETIRNRIDEFGVAEPSIQQQGADRILVQLPGMADAEKAKALINTAAKLDFMMVLDDKVPPDLNQLIADVEKTGNYSIKTLKYSEYISRINQDLRAKLPEKSMILFEKADNAQNMEAGRYRS